MNALRRNQLSGLLLAVIFYAVATASAQEKDLWSGFQFADLQQQTRTIQLKPGQIAAIRRTIQAHLGENDACLPEDVPELVKGLTFDEVPLKQGALIVRATAGAGCARGGQGANGSMWLFEAEGRSMRFLGQSGGWGMAIRPTEVNRFHDFVTGWHASARETGLGYYRFDGKTYKLLKDESAEAFSDGDDGSTWHLERKKPAASQKQ